MSRNGSGTYSLPAGNPVVTGTTIQSTWANTTLSDIATALTQSLSQDGQTPVIANLPMGGFKLTGLGAGTTAGDSVRYEQFASPPAIGNTTPAAGSFTTLSASSTVSGTGFSTYLASPPAIGGTAPAAGNFTTVGATGQITSTVATGTAPFVVSSTTPVTNLSIGGSSGSCTGNAANVTGTVAIANGGTGQTTAAGAATALGIIGIGQTYSAPARVNGGSYTNSGSKPILVVICANVQSTSTITVGGVNVVSLGGGIVQALSFTFIVPPGLTYSATFSAGSIYYWSEMS